MRNLPRPPHYRNVHVARCCEIAVRMHVDESRHAATPVVLVAEFRRHAAALCAHDDTDLRAWGAQAESFIAARDVPAQPSGRAAQRA